MLLICTMVLLFNCQFYGMISYTLNLGCTDTPFLVSCWCWTRVGHRNGYNSPDSGFRRVSSFFFFFSFLRHAPTRRRHGSDAFDTPAVKKKRKRHGSDAFDTPAVKKKRKFRHISGHSGYSGQFRPK